MQFYSEFQKMVHDFNIAMGTKQDQALKARLIQEEADELVKAVEAEDPVETLDALCDLLYVLYGAADFYHVALFTEEEETTPISRPPQGISAIKRRLREAKVAFKAAVISVEIGAIYGVKEALDDVARACWLMGSQCIGMDLRPFFEEVHRTNMLKTTGPVREDGKRLKPEGWKPPRIETMYAKRKGMPCPEDTP
jgi:predicted HAD superfamily Cof-like phosphohydrolase